MLDKKATKQLAQVRPAGTAAVSALLKPEKAKYVITSIVICNTTGSGGASSNYSIYLDGNGTTYDESTALYFAVALAKQTTDVREFADGLPMDAGDSANLAVQTSTGSALTFTINGYEF